MSWPLRGAWVRCIKFSSCTSWIAWNGIRTRFGHLWWNEVVEIFWSSWLHHGDPWAFLCLITSCIAEPLLPDDFSKLVHVFQVLTPRDVTPVINGILKCKEAGSPIICRGYLRGRLLRHMDWGLLRCSSHCIGVVLIPSICIDNVEVIIIIAMAGHFWALPGAHLQWRITAPLPLEEGH